MGVAGEEPALDHLQQPRLYRFQTGQKVIEHEQILGLRLNRDLSVPEGGLLNSTASLLPSSAPRIIDDHVPHGAGRDREEVIAIRQLAAVWSTSFR